MSEYLGSRISLISKSDIRYVGTLHEINSEESTVSLENVKSYGTEGRKSRPEEEISPSDQVYEYIVFRGSDVKDLRIEESPPVKENKPPAVPNDPAILGARPRPDAPQGPSAQPAPPSGPGAPGAPGGPAAHGGGPPGAPGFPHPGQGFNNNFYGPPGSWGRGGPPNPFNNMPYPPPPGWFPPGQGFPPGPGGPGPWGNYPFPPGGPGPAAMGGQEQGQKNRATPVGGAPSQEAKQSGPSAATDKKKEVPASQQPTDSRSLRQATPQAQNAPALAGESRPSLDQAQDGAPSAGASSQQSVAQEPKAMPTGPKNSRLPPAIPAMPRPFQVPSTIAGSQSAAKPAAGPSAASIQDATEAAKAAVAIAMAKMEGAGSSVPAQPQSNGPMDNLTKKVQEMRVNAARTGQQPRGRGRGGRGGHKVTVPDSDFDFASSNAKFNKEEVVKEAIAGSPVTEAAEAAAPESTPDPAYNKSKSFFDNISSEAKDRAESGQKPGGREWRGEEQRKNIETFGQGSVDGGYRTYRGRGRGRGGMRGRGYQHRGGRGGFRGRDQSAQSAGQ